MQQSNFPVILYDIENNVIPINCIARSNSFFVRSYQLFSIEIIESTVTTNLIYNAVENPTPTGPDDLFIISSGKSFSNINFGYTLYLTENTTIKVIGIDNVVRYFNVRFSPDNVLTESQEHYYDALTNNDLPSFEELEPAIISENKADMIKRLLLDFKNIINKKGTKTGIIKFLNLIGFNPESIKVYEEYITPNNQITLTPNRVQDIKTGYYHVIFNNWTVDDDIPYTIKNLPRRIITINNLDEFFEKLWYAIVLANRYFTLPEQDISFFGLNNSANVERFLSIAGNTTITYEQDVHHFRRHIHIDLFNHQDSNNRTYLVRNNLQINLDAFNSEIKTYSALPNVNEELYLVDLEIFDDEIPTGIDEFQIKSIFGNLQHLTIDSPNTYVEYIIENVENSLTKIQSEKIWLTTPLHLNIVSTLAGQYKVTIFIYDIHNNREKYEFEYNVNFDISRIDFDIYNSSHLLNDETNDLDSDIESHWLITELEDIPNDYILPLDNVPTDLSTYYDVDISTLALRYLRNNQRLILEPINPNFIVDKATQVIPVDFMDNWLEVASFPYDSSFSLKLRCVNDLTQKVEILDYNDSNAYTSNPDKLFVTIMDIIEDQNDTDTITPWIFITTVEGNIDLVKNMYDLVLVNNTDENDIMSIYDDLLIFNKAKIPLNYDFPLFFRTSTLVPAFVNHPASIPVADEDTDYLTLPVVKSLYPRLINITSILETYMLRLGDVIFCKPNRKYIINETDILWTVFNSFTNEVLFTSTDYMLKYRISDNTIFTVQLEFKINGTTYTIRKESIQSSFE